MIIIEKTGQLTARGSWPVTVGTDRRKTERTAAFMIYRLETSAKAGILMTDRRLQSLGIPSMKQTASIQRKGWNLTLWESSWVMISATRMVM